MRKSTVHGRLWIRAPVSAWLLVSIIFALAVSASHAMAEPKKVTFSTDFGYNGRHALFYVALDKGFFRDEGLDVTILGGKGSGSVAKELAAGVIDIGFVDASIMILARGNDDVPLKMVAVVYADSPYSFVVMEDSGINSPKDLEGKTIAESPTAAPHLLFPAYAQKAGIDPKKVNWLLVDSTALPGLLISGQAQAAGQFLVGVPLFAKRASPRKVKALEFRAVGLSQYSNGIVVREDKIAADPEMVKGFVRAVQKAMAVSFADPAEAGRIMAKYNRQIDPQLGREETELVRDLAHQDSDVAKGLGYIDPGRMQETIRFVSTYFGLKRPVNVSDIVAPGFVGPP